MFDNFLTKISAQVGLHGFVGFLTFIAVLNPVTRMGCGLMILLILAYFLAAVYNSYVIEKREHNNHSTAMHYAISDNLGDFIFFIFFLSLGIFLATY